MTSTAFYDGECIVCQSVKFVLRRMDWNSKIRWTDLHDKALVQQQMPEIDYERDYDAIMSEIYVKTDEHGVLKGFEGARHLLGLTPLGRPVWALLWLPGVDLLGDSAYKFISRNRYRINRLVGRDLDHLDDAQQKRAGVGQ